MPYGGVKNSNGYTVPKGKKEKDEDLLTAAIRETLEESNFDASPYKKQIVSLGSCKYKHGKKRFHGFALELDFELSEDMFSCQIRNGDLNPEIVKFCLVPLDDITDKLHYTQSEVFVKMIKKIRGREKGIRLRKRKENVA